VAEAFQMRDKLDGLPCLSWGFMGSLKEGRDLRGVGLENTILD